MGCGMPVLIIPTQITGKNENAFCFFLINYIRTGLQKFEAKTFFYNIK